MNKEKKISNLKKSRKEKSFDAVKFKRRLQENVWQHSKAKNSKEFMEYVNNNARKSILYRRERERERE